MNAVIFSFTAAGTGLSARLHEPLTAMGLTVEHQAAAKFASMCRPLARPFPLNLQESVRQAFKNDDVLIFIGAAAIAVRTIAPNLRGKDKDPAVIVIDEEGRYVVPILSGHIGGANELARAISRCLSAQAVVTTATDIRGLFAVDEWAARHGLCLSSLQEAKAFASGLLERGIAGVYSEFPLEGQMPLSLVQADKGPLGLAVTIHEGCRPFATTVAARPKILHIGVGCRMGIRAEQIAGRVGADMEKLRLSWDAVADIDTIDIKKEERGLTQFADSRRLPVKYYSARQLNEAPGRFISSDFVRRVVGTDNVCERAAVLASGGGKLLLEKSGGDGVTVAIACEQYAVKFDAKEKD